MGIFNRDKNPKIHEKHLIQWFQPHFGLRCSVMSVVWLQLSKSQRQNLTGKYTSTTPRPAILFNCPKPCPWWDSIITIFCTTVFLYNSSSNVWSLQQHCSSWFAWRIIVPALQLIHPYLVLQSTWKWLNWCLLAEIIVAFEFPELPPLLLMLLMLFHCQCSFY